MKGAKGIDPFRERQGDANRIAMGSGSRNH